MQLVSVEKDFFIKCKMHGTDRELLYDKQGRPCVLIVDLVYKRQKHTFVVPLRSIMGRGKGSPMTPDIDGILSWL